MPKLKLNPLLIIDLEATCWENRQRPPGERPEIIEIGICTFDTEKWKPLEKHQIIVKPTQSSVSDYCHRLTGWTQKALDTHGIPLVDACNKLTSVYNSKVLVWASWGDYDRLQMYRECELKSIRYPFSMSHLNLKLLFTIHMKLRKQVGMANALKMLGLKLEGTHHKGADDAWNIGRILESQGRP